MLTVEPQDLPLLGEPLPVELANTRYGLGQGAFDFLGSPDLAQLWLATAPTAHKVRLGSADHGRLVALRDLTFELLHASLSGTRPLARRIGELNELAMLGHPRRTLEWSTSPCVRTVRSGPAFDQLLGDLATRLVDLLASDERGRLRMCDAPDCTMLFIKQHHRRRWCYSGCGHRMRQAAYYRRQRGRD